MTDNSAARGACHAPTISFSTEHLAPADRYEAWRSLVGQTHDIDADPDGFAARVTSTTLDRMIVRTLSASPQSSARSPRRVRADALDNVMLHFTTAPWDLEIDGRCVRVPAGSVAVNSLTRPFRRSASAEHGSVFVHLSRDLVTEALPDPEAFHGHIVPNARDTMLGTHLWMLAGQAAELPQASRENIARATAQLLAATLAPAGRTVGEARPAIRGALLTQCKRYIEGRLRSPELSLQTICRDVGLSRSALYRLFAPSGGVTDYIRDRRLAAAMTTLSAPSAPRISDVARDLGFADLATFSRAFRTAFGCSPRDVVNDRGCVLQVESDVFSEWVRAMR